MTIKVAIFDAYGTLFDVAAAAREAAAEPGQEALAEHWQALAAHWRAKQLQYTWLRAITGDHTDFWTVTQDGLDWALEAVGIDDTQVRERLLALYWELSAYPEVPAMLAALKSAGCQTGILSNGSPEMLQGAVRGIDSFPEDLAGRLEHLILSHHGRYEFGSPTLPMISEAFVLNFLDDLDAKLNYLGRLEQQAPDPGYQWTDFQRTLERFLFVRGRPGAEPEVSAATGGEDANDDSDLESKQQNLF